MLFCFIQVPQVAFPLQEKWLESWLVQNDHSHWLFGNNAASCFISQQHWFWLAAMHVGYIKKHQFTVVTTGSRCQAPRWNIMPTCQPGMPFFHLNHSQVIFFINMFKERAGNTVNILSRTKSCYTPTDGFFTICFCAAETTTISLLGIKA